MIPLKKIGEDKFNKTALDEAKVDGNFYSVPLYSHAQVMWVPRTDLLKQYNIEVPKHGTSCMKLQKIKRKWSLWIVCSFLGQMT